ncbi:hypothetical protein UlMin_039062 [Ulmus minor]
MPASRQVSRIDTLELKSHIQNKVGLPKAEMYFNLLTGYLSHKINKQKFHRLCVATIGKENLHLHNQLIRSIVKNACLSTTPPPKFNKEAGSLSVKVPNGYQRSSLQSLCRDIPQSPRKGRTPGLRDRKFKDRLSPLGPHGNSHSNIACENSTPKIQEQQSASELLSLGSRPPCSVEDGEEVEQAAGSPGIYSRIPLTAPLGILQHTKSTRKFLCKESASTFDFDTCQNKGKLPDTSSLAKRLEHKLETEGLKISMDCANLLNESLDLYLKRLIKPSLELAASRSRNKIIDQGNNLVRPGLSGMYPMRYTEKPNKPSSVSLLDFRVAMELNPQLLGEDWPAKLDRICSQESDNINGI